MQILSLSAFTREARILLVIWLTTRLYHTFVCKCHDKHTKSICIFFLRLLRPSCNWLRCFQFLLCHPALNDHVFQHTINGIKQSLKFFCTIQNKFFRSPVGNVCLTVLISSARTLLNSSYSNLNHVSLFRFITCLLEHTSITANRI